MTFIFICKILLRLKKSIFCCKSFVLFIWYLFWRKLWIMIFSLKSIHFSFTISEIISWKLVLGFCFIIGIQLILVVAVKFAIEKILLRFIFYSYIRFLSIRQKVILLDLFFWVWIYWRKFIKIVFIFWMVGFTLCRQGLLLLFVRRILVLSYFNIFVIFRFLVLDSIWWHIFEIFAFIWFFQEFPLSVYFF
jgi:hypothetical protein